MTTRWKKFRSLKSKTKVFLEFVFLVESLVRAECSHQIKLLKIANWLSKKIVSFFGANKSYVLIISPIKKANKV